MYNGDIHAKGVCVVGDIHLHGEAIYMGRNTYTHRKYIWRGHMTGIYIRTDGTYTQRRYIYLYILCRYSGYLFDGLSS